MLIHESVKAWLRILCTYDSMKNSYKRRAFGFETFIDTLKNLTNIHILYFINGKIKYLSQLNVNQSCPMLLKLKHYFLLFWLPCQFYLQHSLWCYQQFRQNRDSWINQNCVILHQPLILPPEPLLIPQIRFHKKINAKPELSNSNCDSFALVQ